MIASALLPDLHKDPFDRLLVAQARRHESVLVTRDTVVSQYDAETTVEAEILKHLRGPQRGRHLPRA